MVKRALIILAYIIAIIVFTSLYGFFMSIHPRKFTTDINMKDLDYEAVEFKTSDGLTLRGWFLPSNHSKATIIVTHGYPFDKANILPVAKFLNRHFNLLFFDFRYFGESEGKYTTVGYKEKKDLSAAIDYIKSRKDLDKNKIGAWGISLGAATIIMTAAENKDLKAIVADSSYANLDKMVRHMFPYSFLKYPFVLTTKLVSRLFLGISIDKISPMNDIKRVDIPKLIIHGTADSQIPVENAHLIYDAASEPKQLWIVDGAEHCQAHATVTAEYEKKVMDFFDKHII